jgi:hypothetical protein
MVMKVSFDSPLDVVEISDQSWQLNLPFRASVSDDAHRRVIEVPAGFVTDFASVPRLPVVFLLAGDTAHKPALLHDYLYSLGGDDAARLYADYVLRAGMAANGDPWWRRALVYRAVRLFGASHWCAR